MDPEVRIRSIAALRRGDWEAAFPKARTDTNPPARGDRNRMATSQEVERDSSHHRPSRDSSRRSPSPHYRSSRDRSSRRSSFSHRRSSRDRSPRRSSFSHYRPSRDFSRRSSSSHYRSSRDRSSRRSSFSHRRSSRDLSQRRSSFSHYRSSRDFSRRSFSSHYRSSRDRSSRRSSFSHRRSSRDRSSRRSSFSHYRPSRDFSRRSSSSHYRSSRDRSPRRSSFSHRRTSRSASPRSRMVAPSQSERRVVPEDLPSKMQAHLPPKPANWTPIRHKNSHRSYPLKPNQLKKLQAQSSGPPTGRYLNELLSESILGAVVPKSNGVLSAPSAAGAGADSTLLAPIRSWVSPAVDAFFEDSASTGPTASSTAAAHPSPPRSSNSAAARLPVSVSVGSTEQIMAILASMGKAIEP